MPINHPKRSGPAPAHPLASRRRRGLPILLFGITLAALIAGGLLGTYNTQRLIDTRRRLALTDDGIVELGKLMTTIDDAQASQRGYLLTGDEAYLEPYQASTGRLRTELARLSQLESDPRQRARLAALERAIDLKLAELGQTIALARAGERAVALAIVRTNVGRARMEAIRARVAAMQSAERNLLARREAEAERRSSLTIATIVVSALIGTALLALVFYLSARNLRLERRAAETLAAERERLRVTLASIGEAVLTTDRECRITFANPVAESLTGWPGEQMLGQPLEAVFRIVNEQTRASLESPARRALREGVAVTGTDPAVLVRARGAECPIEVGAAPMLDAAGSVVGSVLVFRDVTERRRAEQRLASTLMELRAADRHKDEFLALLAHELRGPLAPLLNSVEILKRAQGDEGILTKVQGTMERQLGQLVRLVNDLLDVSRIARGQIELRREPVDLGGIVQQSVEACRPLAGAAGHTLTVNVPEEPVYVDGDPARLAQVLSNLLHNACKYTEPGGHIALRLGREGREALIRVSDTGIGIPPGKLEGIFDLFVQLDRRTERAQGGLGVGLAVVKRLVTMHGGSVEARSEGAGRGSEFIVRLPVASGAGSVAGDASPIESVPARRVLVVDDNVDTATSLSMLLQKAGHDAHTAYEGLQALSLAEELHPDVILLDVGLPRLNGYDVCRRIRERSWARNTLIVAVTGWGQEEDRRRSAAAGFDAHLVKPPEYAALMQVLSAAEARARSLPV
jgi:PAS domain S-box-containing protein